ncbi:hypothetical protein SOVF_191670 [Spinacia oleracea]|nr:hypothetical protein SOVF_191670 [Spinacia oleracea]
MKRSGPNQQCRKTKDYERRKPIYSQLHSRVAGVVAGVASASTTSIATPTEISSGKLNDHSFW